MDNRARKLAEVLLKYSLGIKKGNKVLLSGGEAVIPFIKEAYRIAIEMGAHPIVDINLDGTNEAKLRYGNEEQVAFISEGYLKTIETVDAVLSIWGENNTRSLTSIHPETMKHRALSRKPFITIFNNRLEKGEMKWCGTQYPSNGDAQEASMSLEEYENLSRRRAPRCRPGSRR
jgi:aminopeptidase